MKTTTKTKIQKVDKSTKTNSEVIKFVKLVRTSQAVAKVIELDLLKNKGKLILDTCSFLYSTSEDKTKGKEFDTIRRTLSRVSGQLAKDEKIASRLGLKLADKETASFKLIEKETKAEDINEKMLRMVRRHKKDLNDITIKEILQELKS